MDNPKAAKLHKLFNSIIYDRQPLSHQNKPHFLEALYTSPDPAGCVDSIISSPKGLSALQSSLRMDMSPPFLNGAATKVVLAITAPEVTSIDNGAHVQKVVMSIVEPPIFWGALLRAFQAGQLGPEAQKALARLLLQMVMLPLDKSGEYVPLAQDPSIIDVLAASPDPYTRGLSSQITYCVKNLGASSHSDLQNGPGGRHDNDHANFREISILPTAAELESTSQKAFLRPSSWLDDPSTEKTRVPDHLDNQFRLLREDMVSEMREEVQIALGKKKSHHKGFVIDGVTLKNVYYKDSGNRECKWALTFQCKADLWQFKKCKDAKGRSTYVKDNPRFMKHHSLTCLLIDGQVAAFPSVIRDDVLLAQKPPTIVLRFDDKRSTVNALVRLPSAQNIKLIQIDTAVFSYEPVLTALQEKKGLPLEEEILFFKGGMGLSHPKHYPSSLVRAIQYQTTDLQSLLNTPKPINLDHAQRDALVNALSQRVALIQGPPGTGKSFVGALCAKILLEQPQVKILVNCYTNHALDQFLEDLMDIGIAEKEIVRVGGKSTLRTAPLSLQTLGKSAGYRLTKNDWREIDGLRARRDAISTALEGSFARYQSANPGFKDIMEHLQFEYADFAEAFYVPESEDESIVVGKKGKAVEPLYLLRRWWYGQDAGVFQNAGHIKAATKIWKMGHPARLEKYEGWKQELMKEQVEHLYELGQKHNECVVQMDAKFRLGEGSILQARRVIGCTTTGAAMYRDFIKAAGPTVLLVEEAGEILEPHTITAMSDSIEQVILIGDHKQLRPKVNNYYLTVEKGEGFDLNISLFERLVLKNYPHTQLNAQHRMRPEISALVRDLTYPKLQDAPKTKGRPNIRGIRSNVVFINHEQPEDEVEAEERKDVGTKSSKQNNFEVEMVLKIVRYLGQQGYGTDKLVILTPYLGQLRAIMNALRKAQQSDPVLSDLDSYDLVRAGLMSDSAAKSVKKQIRLATIDNYQGEESEIVIASLTRSNPDHEIGFMSSPERLNVLLSRARDGLIIIGNTQTFTKARRGGQLWTSLIELLKKNGNIYDGLPVVCDRHPNRRALLKTPDDFDKNCPDGGCNLPCGTLLSCNQHPCPSKCHQLADHSQMLCEHVSSIPCPKGHSQQWKCHKGPPPTCIKCEREQESAEKKRQAQFALQEKRDAEQRAHERQMAELEVDLARERETIRYAREVEERKRALEQKRMDVDAAAEQAFAATSPPRRAPTPPETPGSTNVPSAASMPATPLAGASIPKPRPSNTNPVSTSPSTSSPTPKPKPSAAKEEWERQKRLDGAVNPPIDAIMEMTGLENVKKQVLRIKTKAETSTRQGTDLKNERFNIAMLGNPGTGKTTVARHYAKFLASVDIIPTDTFFETTGSRLTNEGVPGIKKQVETMLGSGGGTVFVDEAYQLTTDGRGKQVLDFILAEMENNVGKIVWIVAGYNREMEQFFEHNPGLQSRVPYTLQFDDYEDDELLSMLENLIDKQFKGKMKVEEGIRGLYARIAIRRLGRGRGRNGFGNARALRNLFDKINGRQAERLSEERRSGNRPDDFLLLRQDLIGPDPSSVMGKSNAWKTLQSMIGLAAVKKSVQSLFDMTILNYQRELQELKPDAVSLNRVFLGSPGTGKTSVAKLYGQILAELGLISNGEVVVKNPADFVGSALGQSEANTKSILANTVGKVLIIDEAYMLYASSGAPGGTADPYKTAVIDTIVAEVQSVPGEDRCVLLLGYKDQMEEMFQNVNPGLSRRFSIENAFHFYDYSDSELLKALDWKLKSQDRTATDAAKNVAIEVLARLRPRLNFGNIGEVENLLSAARMRYQERQSSLPLSERSPNAPFEPQDFDPEFDRSKDASSNLAKLFEDMIGAEEIIAKLHKWQQMAKVRKAMGKDLQMIPTNFIFKGPPGVGKTTVARKMGAVYYDMGILSSKEVVECSASDLVGQYVGQTGPKTKKQFERALGRVLFIDEAYRLAEGHFSKEAMDELVGILTHDNFRGKLIVILAGYDQEMNDLLQVNTGLSSRFPEEILFPNIAPAKCLEILDRKLRKESVVLPTLNDPSRPAYAGMIGLIEKLSALPSWGNARDMETLAKKICEVAFTREDIATDGTLEISADDAISCISTMLDQRQDRVKNRKATLDNSQLQRLMSPPSFCEPPAPPILQTVQATTKIEVTDQLPEEAALDQEGRDPGVSDAIWEQLQQDAKIAEEARRHSDEAMDIFEDEERAAAEQGKALEQALQVPPKDGDDELEELKRRREAARLQELRARMAREAEARRRAEEARVQAKLQQIGRCVAGYAWVKQATGYRCSAGGHFVTNAALGL